MANNLINVEGYLQDYAIHLMQNSFCVTRSLNDRYLSYQNLAGTLGPNFLVNLPTRTIARSGFGFTADGNSGSFSQRSMRVSADEEISAEFPYTDIDYALFDKNEAITQAAMSNINEMAIRFESFYTDKVANSGYRFFGSPAVTSGQMTTVPEITRAVNQFDSFGCVNGAKKYVIMPPTAAADTISSGLQQFVTDRNEKLALAGEIGYLGGVRQTIFCNSNLLSAHIAGTAADNPNNLTPGYTIVSVTPTNPTNPDDANGDNTSVIVLSGMTAGETVVENDMLDIGQLSDDPLRFLTFTGYRRSENPVQARVTVGGTVDGAGNLTITVQPAFIFDGTETNPYRNLSRAIVPGTDTIRFCKSHIPGLMYFGEYGIKVNPKLPNAEPYDGATIRNKETGIAIRAFYGKAGIDKVFKYFVHEALLGYGAASEGFARILYPLQ